MERTLGELITAFFNTLGNTDLAGNDFVVNLEAGLVIMVIEIVAVVFGVGGLLSFLEKRKWDRTRQALANVLLTSINSVMGHLLNMIHKFDVNVDAGGEQLAKDGSSKKAFVLNRQIELHILKMNVALANFDAQTIVHLPALLPDISENLSDITRTTSSLSEAAAALKYHYYNIEEWLNTIVQLSELREDIERYHWINPQRFCEDDKKKIHLKITEEPSEYTHFFLTYVQALKRVEDLSKLVYAYVEKFHNSWKGFKETDIEKALDKQSEFEMKLDMINHYRNTLVNNGIYLSMYTPSAAELAANDGKI
tara:strand:+ start:13500 stop:14426 length:927 start_codon:yes stop_codon:yes gene_type:complete